MAARSLGNLAREILAMAVASVLLIVLGLIYFLVTSWIVVMGVRLALGASPSPDFTALAAAIVTIGSLVGGRSRGLLG